MAFDRALKKHHLYVGGNNLYITEKTFQQWVEVFQEYNGDDRVLMRLPYLTFSDVILLLNKPISIDDVIGCSLLISRQFGKEFLTYLTEGNWDKPFTKNLRAFSKIALPYGCFRWKTNTSLDERSKNELVKIWDSIFKLTNDII